MGYKYGFYKYYTAAAPLLSELSDKPTGQERNPTPTVLVGCWLENVPSRNVWNSDNDRTKNVRVYIIIQYHYRLYIILSGQNQTRLFCVGSNKGNKVSETHSAFHSHTNSASYPLIASHGIK